MESVGRRKTAIARVRLFPGTGKMTVNAQGSETVFRPLSSACCGRDRTLTALKIAGEWDINAQFPVAVFMRRQEPSAWCRPRTREEERGIEKATPRFRIHDPRFPYGGTQKVRPQKSPSDRPSGQNVKGAPQNSFRNGAVFAILTG